MGLGVWIFLIVLGAVLAIAVTADVAGIDVQTLGVIVLLVGVGGLGVSLWRLMQEDRTRPIRIRWVERRRRPVLSAAQRQAARSLAEEGRVFLDAERYTEGRIEELAVEFVRRGVGQTRDEFVAWALAQGTYGPELPGAGPP